MRENRTTAVLTISRARSDGSALGEETLTIRLYRAGQKKPKLITIRFATLESSQSIRVVIDRSRAYRVIVVGSNWSSSTLNLGVFKEKKRPGKRR